MLWTNIKRVIRAGFVNFWRNGFVSLSSVFVMVIALMIIGSVLFSGYLLKASLDQVKSKVDVNVYFITTASEEDMLAVQKSVDALPEVASTKYQTRDEVLAEFKEKHKGEESILQALDEVQNNPFGGVLNVKAKDPSQYMVITSFIQSKAVSSQNGLSIVYDISYLKRQLIIDKLTKLISVGEKFGLALTIVLIVISIMITFNTIRLAIYTSKEEISIMRLVGASSKYVRGPFVIVGIMYGVISALIALALFYPITFYLGRASTAFLDGINLFSYYINNFALIFLVLVGTGVVVGAISSYLAVRRYLKV